MKDDLKYTVEHKNKSSQNLYPTEWVVRTLGGNYPRLKIDKSNYHNRNILDSGFGDGRNFQLLADLGFNIHGTEINEQIVEFGYDRLKRLKLKGNLKVSRNKNIAFSSNYFDYILASSSIYYVEDNSTFLENKIEHIRVLNHGGSLIANFPHGRKHFIFNESDVLQDQHFLIKNDIHKLRNGCVLKGFTHKDEIMDEFKDYFENISIGYLEEDYYGYKMSMFIMVADKLKKFNKIS